MKKDLLFLFIFLQTLVSISFAQISKGSVLLGGDLSAYTEKQINNGIEYKLNGFNISPLIGKAIKNNLFFGGYFDIGNSNDGTNTAGGFKERLFGAGIFLRRYGIIKNNFLGFIQGKMGVIYDKQEFLPPNNTSYITRKTIGAALSPGLSYRISKKLHLEAGLRELVSLGYSNQESNFNNSGIINHSKSNRFYISGSLNNFNSSLYFGFRLLING